MSKVVQVANAIISNPQNINIAIAGNDDLYFLYKDKYSWSIRNSNDEFYLYFYPGTTDLNRLLHAENTGDWDHVEMVCYSTEQIATAEAIQTFSELYNLIKEKAYGIDAAFKDILSDMEL